MLLLVVILYSYLCQMEHVQLFLGAVVILLMLGLGAAITIQDFKRAARLWRAPVTAVLCQFGVMPLIALCLALLLGVTKMQGLSMLVVGCSPGGSTSNLFTYYSRGDLPLSIIATTCSTLLSLVLMPLALLAYSAPFTDETVHIPYASMVLPLGMVIVPVALGMATKHYSSTVASFVEKTASILGMLFILAALIGGIATNLEVFTESWELWVGAFVLMPIGSGFGYLISYCARLPPRACRTVCLETGLQNSTLALTILAFSFQDADQFKAVSVFPLMYSLALLIDGSIITLIFNCLSRKEDLVKSESTTGNGTKLEKDLEKPDSASQESKDCGVSTEHHGKESLEDLVSVVI